MQSIEKIQEIAETTEQTILAYYDYSFRVEPEKCMVLIQKLISEIETLFGYLQAEKQKELSEILARSLEAMDKQDYVLLRDVLYYELRQFLSVLIPN